MMHRRRLLQMLGLAAVAPALPTTPAAKPALTVDELSFPLSIVAEDFQDPLYAIASTQGTNGERYRHHMPATMRYQDGPAQWQTRLVVEFTATFNGTVRSVEIARGDNTLVTLYRDAFDSPHWNAGMLVRVTIGTDNNPSEAA